MATAATFGRRLRQDNTIYEVDMLSASDWAFIRYKQKNLPKVAL
jgi:hypothetical protein